MLYSASVTIHQTPAATTVSVRPVPFVVGVPQLRAVFGISNVHFYEETLTPTPNTNPVTSSAITEDDSDLILIDDYYTLGF